MPVASQSLVESLAIQQNFTKIPCIVGYGVNLTKKTGIVFYTYEHKSSKINENEKLNFMIVQPRIVSCKATRMHI